MAQPPQTRTVRNKGQAQMRMQGMPGPNRQVREMCSPQQFREVALSTSLILRQHNWPRGPMYKASAYRAGDCRLESCRCNYCVNLQQHGLTYIICQSSCGMMCASVRNPTGVVFTSPWLLAHPEWRSASHTTSSASRP